MQDCGCRPELGVPWRGETAIRRGGVADSAPCRSGLNRSAALLRIGDPNAPTDSLHPGFIAERGEWWAMVHSEQLQTTRQEPTYTGRWYGPQDEGTYWRLRSCPDHLEGLTGQGVSLGRR
jgi:hypothetical protein